MDSVVEDFNLASRPECRGNETIHESSTKRLLDPGSCKC